jgi:hypothetical protein
LRKCLDHCIFSRFAQPFVVVSGDLNDGPGLDFFEEYFLLFDSVDVLLGSAFSKTRMLEPLLIRHKYVAQQNQWSCIFSDYVDKIDNKKILLDHIFVSAALCKVVTHAGIAHDVYDRHSPEHEASSLPPYSRQYRLSDHRPVFADFA